MKKVKYLSCALLSVCMIIGLLAGCAGGGGSSDGVTIQWWVPNWDEEPAREIVAEFMELNEGITVEFVITDWDTYKSRVTTAISTSGAPELSTVLLTDVVPFAQRGWAEPLNDIGRDAGIDFSDLMTTAREIMSIDGELYAIPFRYDGPGVYYNVDMLAEIGYDEFPRTWDEMIEMSKKLDIDGGHAFAFPMGNQPNAVVRYIVSLYTYGGDVLNADETESLLDSAAARRALGDFVYAMEEGLMSPASLEFDNTQTRYAFGARAIAFKFDGPYDIEPIQEEFPDINFRTAVVPGENGMARSTANGWCVMMSANANPDHKEAAAQLLAFIALPENQRKMTNSLPASYKALQFEEFDTPYLRPFAEQLGNARAEPTFNRWAEIEPIMFNYIQRALTGAMSVEDAIMGMHNDVNALLAS